jgi:hypothetical protein
VTVKVVAHHGYSFRVMVNYDLPFKTMIAAGKYDRADVTPGGRKCPSSAQFPFGYFQLTGHGQHEIEIVLLQMKSEDTDILFSHDVHRPAGFRSASVTELLALGAAHPELLPEYSIVALGSIAGYVISGVSMHDVPALSRNSRERIVYRTSHGGLFSKDTWFAFVRDEGEKDE